MSDTIRGTTIVAVKKDGKTVIAGDGQITMSQSVILKATAIKVRRIYNEKVVIGFAGSVADAFSLCERFEAVLAKYSGNLLRSAVELAQEWRTDKILRKLEAMMIAADKENMLILSGSGEVIQIEEGVTAIGSGGNYALSAAKAMLKYSPSLSAKEIAVNALQIAGELCVFTNGNITVEEIE